MTGGEFEALKKVVDAMTKSYGKNKDYLILTKSKWDQNEKNIEVTDRNGDLVNGKVIFANAKFTLLQLNTKKAKK